MGYKRGSSALCKEHGLGFRVVHTSGQRFKKVECGRESFLAGVVQLVLLMKSLSPATPE